MKNLILTLGILLGSLVSPSVLAQKSIDKITIKYEDKETYFVYDTTIVNPLKVIKDDNLQPFVVQVKGTLVIDLKK